LVEIVYDALCFCGRFTSGGNVTKTVRECSADFVTFDRIKSIFNWKLVENYPYHFQIPEADAIISIIATIVRPIRALIHSGDSTHTQGQVM
jgi:hypothetical protein